MRAASMISSGIDLIAADSTTIAKPVWIQTMITIRKQVVPRLEAEPRDRLLAEAEHDAVQQPDVATRTPPAGSCRSAAR